MIVQHKNFGIGRVTLGKVEATKPHNVVDTGNSFVQPSFHVTLACNQRLIAQRV